MNKWLVVFAVLGLLMIAGCGKKAAPESTAVPEAPTTTQAVAEFEDDLSEVDSLDEELDTSELDTLDQDLASLG